MESINAAFAALAISNSWAKTSKAYKNGRGTFLISALHKEVRHRVTDYRIELGQKAEGVGEDAEGYGDATKLEVWQALCRMVGIAAGGSLTVCRKVSCHYISCRSSL